jgi:hypothetical protein
MINISGVDIHNCDKKLVLSTIWQIISYYMFKVF